MDDEKDIELDNDLEETDELEVSEDIESDGVIGEPLNIEDIDILSRKCLKI